MPVSRFGPLTTRGGVTFGLLTCNRFCTASRHTYLTVIRDNEDWHC